MSDKILAFVPCYNCEPQITRVIEQLAGPVSAHLAEVLIIDNGSRDGTVATATAALPRLGGLAAKLVRNRDNYNLGGSHKSAFAYAIANGFTHVLVLHGDDQGNVNDIVPQLAQGAHREVDGLLGARFASGSRLIGYSTFRIFGNHVFNTLFTIVSGRRVQDLGSGLNIFGSAIFADPDAIRYSDDLRFNIYLLLDAIDKKRKLRFVPISWREEDQISNVRMMSQARRTLTIAWEYLTQRKRFRTADHRDVAHAGYSFDVLAENPGGSAQNG